MAKVRAHQKKGCTALQHLKDHRCPVCFETFDYCGMRIHLHQFCANNGSKIENSKSPHRILSLQAHSDMKDYLVKAHAEAIKNRTPYVSVYPI